MGFPFSNRWFISMYSWTTKLDLVCYLKRRSHGVRKDKCWGGIWRRRREEVGVNMVIFHCMHA